MDLLTQSLSVLALIGAALYKWVQLTHTQRGEFTSIAFRVAVIVCVGAILVSSAFQVWSFGESSEPLTRRAILSLLLHSFNLVCYFLIACGITGFWLKKEPGNEIPVEAEPTD